MSLHSLLSASYVQSCCRDICYRMSVRFQSQWTSRYIEYSIFAKLLKSSKYDFCNFKPYYLEIVKLKVLLFLQIRVKVYVTYNRKHKTLTSFVSLVLKSILKLRKAQGIKEFWFLWNNKIKIIIK